MTKTAYIFDDTQANPIKAWVHGVPVADNAIEQARATASMPFIYKHVALMPDVHLGYGATVGSVIPTQGAIIPAAVGVDIGCGMMAVRTNITANELPDSLVDMRTAIEAAIPHGRTNNGMPGDRGAWGNAPAHVEASFESLSRGMQTIMEKHPKIVRLGSALHRSLNHMGTLGTGNHFVEVCLDESDEVWIMLHSGSRGIGNAIGSYFINLAKEDMRKWFINLPEADLAYLPEGTEHFDDYRTAVSWAQAFALMNREIMMKAATKAVASIMKRDIRTNEVAVNCHHNYIDKENHFGQNVWVTRKGAVRARVGDLGIIPGSMGARSFIVEGLGEAQSFHSCSHGAGRVMSRTQAHKTFSVEQHIAATEGVECKKDDSVIDETPGAYKDIDAVMEAQKDLVKVRHTLKQVVCVKG